MNFRGVFVLREALRPSLCVSTCSNTSFTVFRNIEFSTCLGFSLARPSTGHDTRVSASPSRALLHVLS